MPKKLDNQAFSGLYLAKALEGKVKAWVDQGWHGVTETTLELFNYWFRRDDEVEEKFYDCQQRAIETAVYCYEILKEPTLARLFQRVAPEALIQHLPLKHEVDTIPFPKYALKMATGSGKTWVLAALLVWQYFNKLNQKLNQEPGKYSYRFLVVTPGHEVLNRLLDSFKGKRDPKTGDRRPETSDYNRSLFIPDGARWRNRFHLEIMEPHDVHTNTTPPDGPFVLITNWQQFRLKKGVTDLWARYTGEDVEEAPRGEVLLDFLSQYPDLIVMNDEAHHVHGKKSATGEELVWRRFMNLLYERLKENHQGKLGAFFQVDYSATPFYGSGQKREFFPHIIYDYDLISAMQHMLVKQLFLEERQSMGGESLEDLDFRAERHEPEGGHRRGEIIGLSAGQKLLLDIGRFKLQQLSKEFKAKGLEKKPVLMVLCENTEVADKTREHFQNLADEDGNNYDDRQVMVIHSELGDADLKEARKRLDKIDVDDDPLRVVISVLMLREGFDKNNICVVVVLRATEADLLLEQIVGRGLRLMFPGYAYPELQDAKRDAYNEIRRNKIPSNSLDFLFIVEHPQFRAFYDALRREGFAIGGGDTSTTTSTGDLMPVDAITERLKYYDISWPIQIYDEGRMPELSQIDVKNLPRYSGDFDNLKIMLSKLSIADRHVETGKKGKTWKLENEYFDYSFFLRQATKAVAYRGNMAVITAGQAKIAELIDDYTSEVCFGKSIDFTRSENYCVLNYTPVFDFIIQTVHQAIVKLIEGYKYEPKGVWAKLSDVPRVMVRESKSVETDKSIYPRVGYQPKGGGFERDFMLEVLNQSADVQAFSKLDRRHRLKITYRDHTAILRNYEVDFIVKTSDRLFLVETKADKDIKESLNVAVKARAAVAWCEQASTLNPPEGLNQPKEWEYLLLSENIFKQNSRLSFEGLIPFCRALRENIIAEAGGKLLI